MSHSTSELRDACHTLSVRCKAAAAFPPKFWQASYFASSKLAFQLLAVKRLFQGLLCQRQRFLACTMQCKSTWWEFTGTREAIAEQLRLGEELRRRVDRMDPVSGSDTEASHSTGSSDAEGSESDGASPSRSSRKASAKTRAAAAAILEGAYAMIRTLTSRVSFVQLENTCRLHTSAQEQPFEKSWH